MSNNSNGKKRPILPLMTPRNLSSATPLRFNQSSGDNLAVESSKAVKSEEKPKTKAAGYVDRAAQRRLGFDQNVSLAEIKVTKNEIDKEAKAKAFLEDSSADFPTCHSEWVKKTINLVLLGIAEESKNSNAIKSQFKTNEAFLQFKSIEETKTQPFDPYCRPRKVFRASARLKDSKTNNENESDSEVIERVKEALMRLQTASDRNKKYLEVLKAAHSEEVNDSDDIFPDVGRFDESAFIEKSILEKNSKSESIKNRLFSKSKSKPAEPKNVDVFELIAQKSLNDEDGRVKRGDEETSGGIFGFSGFLPKLSRLEGEERSKGSTNSGLSGAYASILSDEESEVPYRLEKSSAEGKVEEDEDYLYPGYLENDPMAFDSDEDAVEDSKGPSKRKLARKEDKVAAKVEKLVKNKFGVDLSK